MDSDRISHIPDPTRTMCENIKSRRQPKQRCDRPATHGKFCGLHFKHPRPWIPSTPKRSPLLVASTVSSEATSAQSIQKWYREQIICVKYRRHGPAYYNRPISTNDVDFFSTESVSDISGYMFFSYCDEDKHVYSFDIRSIYTLIQRARVHGEMPTNPFTRAPIHGIVVRKVNSLVKWLTDRHINVEWAPLSPPTPEQQIRMKVVDLFTKIDELNYYSSPDWMLSLDLPGQKRLYKELHALWTHRAGLSIQQKQLIVPNFVSRLFRYAPWALFDQTTESMMRLNMGVMRMLISSAEDRNDRILGAMYVVSALTLVHPQARLAYPWLYESVSDGAVAEEGSQPGEDRRFTLGNLIGVGWLGELIALAERERMPPLRLPPPSDT
jgi:hypothetical protein